MYWQYKPLADKKYSIKDPTERTKFISDSKVKFDKFDRAVQIINASKKEDVSLPKAAELNMEIENIEMLKQRIKTLYLKTKTEKERYRNLLYNIEHIVPDENNIKTVSVKKEL